MVNQSETKGELADFVALPTDVFAISESSPSSSALK
jgi:hypothetical protein